MKKLFVLILSLVSFNAQATTCLDLYIEKRDNGLLGKVAEGTTIASGSGIVIGVLAGSSAMMMVGFPVLAIGGGAMLARDARYNRVIDLLKDARDHYKTGGALSAGPDLVKFYKKLRNEELSMMDVAKMLTDANEDMSLCSDHNFKFYRKIKKQYQGRFLGL